MGSLVQIDSISIDLANSVERSDAGKHDHHFSIRGYVSEMRKKDWKLCWPFPLQSNRSESEDQPCLLPPLDVPKYRRCFCQACQQEIAAEGSNKDNQGEFHFCCTGCKCTSDCFSNAAVRSDIQLPVASTPDNLENRGIDLNSSPDLSCGSDCLPTNNGKEKKFKVVNNTMMIDHESGVQDKPNHQITRVPLPEVHPYLIPGAPTNDKGFEGDDVSDVKLATSKVKCVDQNSSEFCNGGTLISANPKVVAVADHKTCSILEVGKVVAVADHTTDDTTRKSPIQSVASQKALPRIAENLVENDFQDHHLASSSGLPRRKPKPRKVRLLTDLLSENVEIKAEKFAIQGFSSEGTSEASETLQTLPTSIQRDLTNMDGSVKRLFLDEELKPAEVSSHRVGNDGQNLERDAEADETIMDAEFKDVRSTIGLQENVKSCWSKHEIDRSLTTNKKKKRNMQIVDEHLRSCSYQNEENKHVAHRVGNGSQNLEGDAEVDETLLDVGFKDSHSTIRLQENVRSCCNKPEIDRSITINKKKKKNKQVVDKHLRPREFSQKGMDSFPLHALRLGIKCNLSKQKGKMLQVDGDLAPLSCVKNDKLIEDSFSVTGAKSMANMPAVVSISSVQGSITNENGVKEGPYLSLNSYLASQAHRKKCTGQIDNQPPFLLSLQEGTSKVHNLGRKGRETDVVGEPVIPYKQRTDAISYQGVSCEVSGNKKHKYASPVEDGNHFQDKLMEITGSKNTQKSVEARGYAGVMKTNGDQTADEVSEQGTLDDIPIEIVELMAKNQHERRLSEAENRRSQLTRCSYERKAQMTVGTDLYGKGLLTLFEEGQKVKPQERHGDNIMISRGQNSRPGKRKSAHYFSPFDDGNHLKRNSLCQPQSSFPFEVSNSQKMSPNGFHFPPMGSSLCGSAQNCKMNGSRGECGSTDSTLQVQGGCSLHKTILHPDDKASHIWESLTPNRLSVGYDMPKRAVSQYTRTDVLHKQNMNRDIDLNCLNLNATGLEKLNSNEDFGTLNRRHTEYPFPCKHNGIDPQQDMREPLDSYSNEIIPAMHLLSLMDAGMKSIKPSNASVGAKKIYRPSYHGDRNSELEIDKALGSLKQPSSDCYNKNNLLSKAHGGFLSSPSLGASSSIQHNEKFIRAGNFSKSGKKEKTKSSNPALQNGGNKQFSWTYVQTETGTPLQRKLGVHGSCVTLPPSQDSNYCSINRNPADFTMPDMENIYMIRGEDLKFEKPINPKKRLSLVSFQGCKQQKILKETKIKDHEKW